ncbi:aldehyde dehydrogenase [Bimuria novae-zelandiae CBS 107.79]|uniref:Aldehyde dehydrogenase n=1 Tax=Bimuria novae-zelandiae CBS 107.79 TaxID=1447943 RepID=A0A6A5VLZ4_9PLEO|nr:aldehyde dehydrogenase [Bimuria novae-zelandiae CBS 107.79]
MAAKLPPFEPTPLEDIPAISGRIRRGFLTHKTRPIEFRTAQLRKLYWALKDNEDLIIEACKRDLGKPTFETYLSELYWCMNDIVFMQKNLSRWAKEEKAENISFSNKLMGPRIRKDPMGAVLVIGAFNFPIQLSFGPLIGAISAGCTAVLKPSEGAPHCAAVMQKILAESLDPEFYAIVQGAVPETSALLDQKWDKIFYTGSANVGTIIAKKAAETLTPIALELGGRNPSFVTKNADPKLAARRLLWGKTFNAGQVCVSQNYTLVDKEMLQPLVKELGEQLKQFYPQGARNSPDYGRIVNQRQFQRLKKMLDESKGKIVVGGTLDEADLFIEPTVVLVDSMDDSLIKDESFGPFLTLLPVNDLDEAIRIANEVHATPLGLYPFGSKAEMEKVLSQTRSGGATLNDGFFHATIPTLEFGGVGDSGQGAYRGKASFDVFTHRRSIVTMPTWIEALLNMRYPPFTEKKLKQIVSASELKPNFDRQGRTIGWGRWLIWLIGIKSVLAVAVAVCVRLYLQQRAKL